MASVRKAKDDTPPPSGHACAMPGCPEAGKYKAPYSRQELHKYRWFCLEHVREYNANWDYFTGMHSSQIEDFMKEAMLGHRPTWKINSQRFDTDSLEAALHQMWHGNTEALHQQKRKKQQSYLYSEQELNALAVLNLNGDESLPDIKKHYKLLVKKHHPDVNKGDAEAAERFKRITEAYNILTKKKKEPAE